MQCANPKVFRLSPEWSAHKYTLFIPCGKCYACECASRAEWALRMREEFKDKRNVSAFFITLTYDDKYLPVVGFNSKQVTDYYKDRPMAERNYWFSVLDKRHASLFIESLKHWFRLHYCLPEYYLNSRTGEIVSGPKRGFKPVYDESTLPRYYLTGEYGDISNRAHMHLIVWFPRELHKMDLTNAAKFLWPYGIMNVQSHISAAARNYVAKHQVKDCCGTEFQNMVSPIFALSSRYKGGIGRIMKQDYNKKRVYLQSLVTGDKSDCYYDNVQGSIVYKIPIPRFLKKDWHPDLYDDAELDVLQKESLKNAKKYIETCMLDQNDFNLHSQYAELIDCMNFRDNDAKIGMICYKLSRKYVIQDKERKELYKRKKRNRKLQSLINSNYSHI